MVVSPVERTTRIPWIGDDEDSSSTKPDILKRDISPSEALLQEKSGIAKDAATIIIILNNPFIRYNHYRFRQYTGAKVQKIII